MTLGDIATGAASLGLDVYIAVAVTLGLVVHYWRSLRRG